MDRYHRRKSIFLPKLIENYQEYDLNKKNQAAERSIRFIDGQLNVIGDSLAFSNVSCSDSKSKMCWPTSDETVRLYREDWTAGETKVDTQVSESYYQYLEKYLQEGRDMDQLFFRQAWGVSDPVLNDLIIKLINVQSELKYEALTGRNTESLVKVINGWLPKPRVVSRASIMRGTDKIKRKFLQQLVDRIDREQVDYQRLSACW